MARPQASSRLPDLESYDNFLDSDSSPESTPALESSERFETPFTSPAGPLPWPVTSPHTTLRTDEGDEFSLVSPSFSSPPSSFCATPTTPALVLPEYSPRLTKKQSTPARLVRSFFASEPVPELPTRTVEAKSSSSGKSLGKRVASILATGFVDNPLHQQYCDNLDQQSSYRLRTPAAEPVSPPPMPIRSAPTRPRSVYSAMSDPDTTMESLSLHSHSSTRSSKLERLFGPEAVSGEELPIRPRTASSAESSGARLRRQDSDLDSRPSVTGTIVGNSKLQNILGAQLPRFPCPRLDLVNHQVLAETLLRYDATKSWRSRVKDPWRVKHVTISSFAHAGSSTTTAGQHFLHCFKTDHSSEMETDRLQLTRKSVVCVTDEMGDGKAFVMKVQGFGATTGQATTWFLSCETSATLSRWLKTLKDIVTSLNQPASRPPSSRTPSPVQARARCNSDASTHYSRPASAMYHSPPPSSRPSLQLAVPPFAPVEVSSPPRRTMRSSGMIRSTSSSSGAPTVPLPRPPSHASSLSSANSSTFSERSHDTGLTSPASTSKHLSGSSYGSEGMLAPPPLPAFPVVAGEADWLKQLDALERVVRGVV